MISRCLEISWWQKKASVSRGPDSLFSARQATLVYQSNMNLSMSASCPNKAKAMTPLVVEGHGFHRICEGEIRTHILHLSSGRPTIRRPRSPTHLYDQWRKKVPYSL